MEWYNADCLDDHLCFLSDVQGWSAEFGSCWRRRWAPTTKQGREDEDVFEIMVRMIEFWTWSMRTIVTGFTDEFVQKLCIEKPLIFSCLETEEALLQLFGGLKVRMTSALQCEDECCWIYWWAWTEALHSCPVGGTFQLLGTKKLFSNDEVIQNKNDF